MSAALSFRDVSYPGFFEGFSCEIDSGCSALIVTAGDAESGLLTRLITGKSYPSHGSVLVDNREVTGLTKDELQTLRKQTGIVPSHGGLISNLKVWENITLPLIYHNGAVSHDDEQTALAHLATLGYAGKLMALPAHLSPHDKRIIALVRALMTAPRIIMYCNCFENLPAAQLPTVSRLTAGFHTTREDRISLYLASSAALAAELAVDRIISVHENAKIFSRNA